MGFVNIFSFSVLSYWGLFVWPNFPFLFQLGLRFFLIYTPCILLSNIQVNKNFFCIFFYLLFPLLCISHCLFSICNQGSSEPPFLHCDFVRSIWFTTSDNEYSSSLTVILNTSGSNKDVLNLFTTTRSNLVPKMSKCIN